MGSNQIQGQFSLTKKCYNFHRKIFCSFFNDVISPKNVSKMLSEIIILMILNPLQPGLNLEWYAFTTAMAVRGNEMVRLNQWSGSLCLGVERSAKWPMFSSCSKCHIKIFSKVFLEHVELFHVLMIAGSFLYNQWSYIVPGLPVVLFMGSITQWPLKTRIY